MAEIMSFQLPSLCLTRAKDHPLGFTRVRDGRQGSVMMGVEIRGGAVNAVNKHEEGVST